MLTKPARTHWPACLCTSSSIISCRPGVTPDVGVVMGDPTIITKINFSGLSAIWAELIFGLKAQIVSHLYVGFNVQLKAMITQDEPTNFANLSVPGFNKIYDSGRFGVGFGYNVSYLIPIYKKNKVVVTPK